jgi:hypothetical protein
MVDAVAETAQNTIAAGGIGHLEEKVAVEAIDDAACDLASAVVTACEGVTVEAGQHDTPRVAAQDGLRAARREGVS